MLRLTYQTCSYGMLRYDDLGQGTLILYRIQAHKKTGIFVGRSGKVRVLPKNCQITIQ
jgi:hypothetical protein